MAVSVEYRDRGFFIEHKGTVTIDEINEVNGAVHGHSQFDAHRFQVVNLLEADFSQISYERSEEPAATDFVASQALGRVRVALVARDGAAVRFCRLYIEESKEFGSPWEFEVFEDQEAAVEWATA